MAFMWLFVFTIKWLIIFAIFTIIAILWVSVCARVIQKDVITITNGRVWQSHSNFCASSFFLFIPFHSILFCNDKQWHPMWIVWNCRSQKSLSKLNFELQLFRGMRKKYERSNAIKSKWTSLKVEIVKRDVWSMHMNRAQQWGKKTFNGDKC